MSGHRQAAVALHALAGADRELILEQLPAGDQAALRGYLDELSALGFESAGARADMLALTAATPVKAAKAADLSAATAATMFALLQREPAALVAQVLALQQWAWGAGLLAMCAPARRQAIEAARVAAAPARARFLRATLDARLAELTPPAVAAVAPSGWRRMRDMVALWSR
ncbi:hypothetical protein CSQ96_20850 [Janthinobacterium sp. BJB412]|nr:hypothetical protein CSQ96_20850 [Janthinobacterium sp. BJB412]